MFWMLKKKTSDPGIFGSILAISEETGLNLDKLYYHFSRMKRLEFENDDYRIVKCNVKRSKLDRKIKKQ